MQHELHFYTVAISNWKQKFYKIILHYSIKNHEILFLTRTREKVLATLDQAKMSQMGHKQHKSWNKNMILGFHQNLKMSALWRTNKKVGEQVIEQERIFTKRASGEGLALEHIGSGMAQKSESTIQKPWRAWGPRRMRGDGSSPSRPWRCRTVKPLRTRAWRFLIKSDMGVGTIIPPWGISSGAMKTCVHIKICTQPFRGDEFTTPKSENNLRFHDDSMVKALRFQSKERGFGPRKLRSFMPCSSTNTHTHTHTHTHTQTGNNPNVHVHQLDG